MSTKCLPFFWQDEDSKEESSDPAPTEEET